MGQKWVNTICATAQKLKSSVSPPVRSTHIGRERKEGSDIWVLVDDGGSLSLFTTFWQQDTIYYPSSCNNNLPTTSPQPATSLH